MNKNKYTPLFKKTFYHAINTQDEYIQLSRLIDLLTWAPSCFVFFNCHKCIELQYIFIKFQYE